MTASLKTEAYKQLVKNVPPDEEESLRVAYTRLFVHYVREYVLSDWHPAYALRGSPPNVPPQ